MNCDNSRIIFILTVLSIGHTIFGISSVISMVSFSLNLDVPIADTLAFLSVLSFIFLGKCVYIDIYNYFKKGIPECDIPCHAKDNYARKKFHQFFSKNEKGDCPPEKDHTNLRLDKICNITPMLTCSEPEEMTLFFNRKIQYILFNSILLIMLSVKYGFKQYLPLFIIWIIITFPA